jgi:hypothetical protein
MEIEIIEEILKKNRKNSFSSIRVCSSYQAQVAIIQKDTMMSNQNTCNLLKTSTLIK